MTTSSTPIRNYPVPGWCRNRTPAFWLGTIWAVDGLLLAAYLLGWNLR